MPDVSVIIPTYNRADYVCEAVESVLSQIYQDFELIIVDDGSTDNTRERLEKYSKRILYVYQENKGVSFARNKGIELSSCPYICFLDSDDIWTERKLEIQTGIMKSNPDIHISYTDEIWIRKGVRVNPKKKHRKFAGDLFEKSLELCIISPSSVMIKRDLFEKTGFFDEELEVCEDYDLWLRITKDYPVCFINKPLIIKRGGHPDQLSHKYWGNDRFRVYAIEKIMYGGFLTSEQKKQALNELIRKCEILAQGFHKRNKFKEREKYLTKIDTWKDYEKNI